MPLTTPLIESGLKALNQGQNQEAIQIFETFCQNAVPNSREHLQAQMHLVKTHQSLGQTERAIELCQELLDCPNAQVQIWAQQILKGLGEAAGAEALAKKEEPGQEIATATETEGKATD